MSTKQLLALILIAVGMLPMASCRDIVAPRQKAFPMLQQVLINAEEIRIYDFDAKGFRKKNPILVLNQKHNADALTMLKTKMRTEDKVLQGRAQYEFLIIGHDGKRDNISYINGTLTNERQSIVLPQIFIIWLKTSNSR